MIRNTALVLVALAAVACSSTSTPTTGTNTGSNGGNTGGTASAVDSGAGGGDTTSSSSDTLNGCGTTSYTDMTTGTATDRMIMLNASGKFDMPCMTIKAGQGVMFMWDFTKYPLTPGLEPDHSTDTGATDPSPIISVTSGTEKTITFKTAGMYPFHVNGKTGMSGVIEVK